LCPGCKNPETDVVIKDPRILLDCKACGKRSEVDSRQKLSGFILKNQPKKGKKEKSTKKSRRDKKGKGENGENGENGDVNGNGTPGDSNNSDPGDENGDLEANSEDEFTRRINEEAKVIEQPEEIDDDDWAVDVSEEAVKARATALPEDLKRALVFDDDEDAEGDNGPSTYDQLGSWIISEAAKSDEGVAGVNDVDIYMKAKELGIESKHKTLAVLAQTIFDEQILKQIPSRAGMLKKVSTVSPDPTKHGLSVYGC
jgi:translation initiation factor 5